MIEKKAYTVIDDEGRKTTKKNINYTLDSLKKIFGRHHQSLDPIQRSKIIRRALFDFLRN